MSWRRRLTNTSWTRLEDVLNVHLGRQKTVTLKTSWRRLEDILGNKKYLLGKSQERNLSLRTLKKSLSQRNLKETLSLRTLKRNVSLRTLKKTLSQRTLRRNLSLNTLKRTLSLRIVKVTLLLRTLKRTLSLTIITSFRTLKDFVIAKKIFLAFAWWYIIAWVVGDKFPYNNFGLKRPRSHATVD